MAITAVVATVAGIAAYQGYEMNKATNKIDDKLPPLPKNATEAEKQARKAATEARKAQMKSAQSNEGRGGTILTGGTQLGSTQQADPASPKSLLGM